ncbi:MAG: type II toxin-antitoxin system prevent-host-death family antitoxin [Erysipelotrichaceae bacterium]|nr:type II toxin-antitoxin system prevent-host-death family antitoxin [Erysipelotrichaceae bacterium]
MNVNIKSLISISEINNNFSKATSIVDKEGLAVILKNNKPKFVVLSYEDYELLSTKLQRSQLINESADRIIDENLDAFLELAK